MNALDREKAWAEGWHLGRRFANKERVVDLFQEELRAALRKHIAAQISTPLVLPGDFAGALHKLLSSYEDLGLVGPAPPAASSSFDPATGRITAAVPLDHEAFARLVDNLYADGMTHEEATAWLEANMPEWRSHVSLVSDGVVTRWVALGTLVLTEIA